MYLRISTHVNWKAVYLGKNIHTLRFVLAFVPTIETMMIIMMMMTMMMMTIFIYQSSETNTIGNCN